MFDLQRTFHFGMAVDDIEAARVQLGADMNLSWTATWLMDPLPGQSPNHSILIAPIPDPITLRRGHHQAPLTTLRSPALTLHSLTLPANRQPAATDN